MKIEHVIHLRCPKCGGELDLNAVETVADRVSEGSLVCGQCPASYDVIRSIPRFISGNANYTSAFGFQWNTHYRTQYDSHTNTTVSSDRFFRETRWPRNLSGQTILEVGSGSGRFTEHAVATGAMVVSFDYSTAVEANYRNNGSASNLLIVQASVYEMPFRPGYFDKVLCIGVIQHTPDPEKTFLALPRMLKDGGELVVDVYKRFPLWKQLLVTKYWVRPLTKRVPAERLYHFLDTWIGFWWPITGFVGRVFRTRSLSWFLLIADYRGVYPLSDRLQREWSLLDSFDMLSPAYDYPQTIATVSQWFSKAGLVDVEIGYGANGIEGRGTRSVSEASGRLN